MNVRGARVEQAQRLSSSCLNVSSLFRTVPRVVGATHMRPYKSV
jgi:hypothetical protein